ncbi:MAG: FtsH protease activity modulator HflK [Hyphomonas sp.]
MPWDDKSKSGGPWGSGGSGNGGSDGDKGSPWGRPNQGGGNKGGSDLEEQMRRMQDKFRQRAGGGGGGKRRGGKGGGNPFGPLGFLVIGGIALFAWLSTGIVVVDETSRAALFKFGEWQRNLEPGIHLHLPAPIETHEILPSQVQQTTEIGSRQDERLMLTGDENIVAVEFKVFWFYGAEPQKFILNVDDGNDLVKAAAESVMREVVGKSQLNAVITDGRVEISKQVRDQLQALLTDYGMGVNVQNVEIQNAAAPDQVLAAFIDVVNANQDAERKVQEANKYANDIIPRAEGRAQQVIQQAEAYREQVVSNATGEASRFNAILNEYRKAPQVTRERMYLETMERVLKKSDKLILDSDSGAVPYLPIDRTRNGGGN